MARPHRAIPPSPFRLAAALAILLSVLRPGEAKAQATRPSAHDDEAFDLMNVLAQQGLHNLNDEPWNCYGQATYISSWKRRFEAAYTNANGSNHSLSPAAERSFTASFTLYFGAHLWKGGEAYFAPEVISLRALSNLNGLGGAVQNFELQKTGSETPEIYRSRLYLQQTIGLGGGSVQKTSDPLQLGSRVDRRRLVVRLGNFSVLDFMDRNAFASDPRQEFLSLAFMTYAAYDFASDARGYSWGGLAELYWDDWALRYARLSPPKVPNALPTEMRLYRYFGDQVELERKYQAFGRAGTVRLLGYLNRGPVGRFDAAIAAYQADPSKNAANCGDRYNYGSTNATAPDLCYVRTTNYKYGVGVSLDQEVFRNLGAFFRGMVSDGQVEVYAYMPPDRSLSFGLLAKGANWKRPFDLAGAAFGLGWISAVHGRYLGLGGVDGFIGDGKIKRAVESVAEVFYSLNLFRALWLSADYQYVRNPAFNADRGPVHILGGRAHAEF